MTTQPTTTPIAKDAKRPTPKKPGAPGFEERLRAEADAWRKLFSAMR